MMDQQRYQVGLEQARRLLETLVGILPVPEQFEPARAIQIYKTQLDCANDIDAVIGRERDAVWLALQNVVFTDIQDLDGCVMALNDWNTLLREAFETLDTAKDRLYLAVYKQYKAYFGMQAFIHEIHKVVTKCILHLGQLAARATGEVSRLGMMDQQQNQALEQARALLTTLDRTLPDPGQFEQARAQQLYQTQRICANEIVAVIERERGSIWLALQNVVFTDINNLDGYVIALNAWNTLVREAFENLDTAKKRLERAAFKQYLVYVGIQEFIHEIHKVVTKCILCLGQLAPRSK